MAQRVRALARGPEFNSQQSHGGSRLSVMRSGALSWATGIRADRTVYIHNKSLKNYFLIYPGALYVI